MKKTAWLLLLTILCGILTLPITAEPISNNGVLAHWKFQNQEGYYTGNIDTDELTFLDLSGNGNDLVARSVGNGNQLDIFSWDTGVDLNGLKNTETVTSLKFNNSLSQAKSVDPYDASQTTFSGAYVSGKYLETVENAPLNSLTGKNGWTVEIIFKISPEWNNQYNRYTGLFSRQGVVESQNEPALSLALSEVSGGNEDGSIGSNGATGLQYVHVDPNEKKTNIEFADGLHADEWVHYMVACNGITTALYCNGTLIRTVTESSKIATVDSSFGWEVGVGRKLLGSNDTSMNSVDPEGLIRRLFCGSVSEIRISEGALSVETSLLNTNKTPNGETEETGTIPSEQVIEPTATTPVQSETTGCSSVVTVVGVVPLLCMIMACVFLRRSKRSVEGRAR